MWKNKTNLESVNGNRLAHSVHACNTSNVISYTMDKIQLTTITIIESSAQNSRAIQLPTLVLSKVPELPSVHHVPFDPEPAVAALLLPVPPAVSAAKVSPGQAQVTPSSGRSKIHRI